MSGLHAYDVEVVALAVSPGHSYWFHARDPRDGMGPHPTLRPDSVEVEAGLGIVGDRFHGRAGTLASAVSFLAAEAVEEVEAELGLAAGTLDPVLARRNVVVRGVDLNALRHSHFSLDTGTGPVDFDTAGETSPCAWMDEVLAPGARDLLRGRGGLRALPRTSGTLRVGRARLVTGTPYDVSRAGARVRRRTPLP